MLSIVTGCTIERLSTHLPLTRLELYKMRNEFTACDAIVTKEYAFVAVYIGADSSNYHFDRGVALPRHPGGDGIAYFYFRHNTVFLLFSILRALVRYLLPLRYRDTQAAPFDIAVG